MLPRADPKSESGFTLIELMVVVLIIGILIAIALPTFLGARTRAADAAAKANLKNAMTAAAAYHSARNTFDSFDTPGIPEAEESSIDWEYGGAAQRGKVTINVAEGDYLVLSAASDSTHAFCVAISYGSSAMQIRGGIDAQAATAGPPLSNLQCLIPTW